MFVEKLPMKIDDNLQQVNFEEGLLTAISEDPILKALADIVMTMKGIPCSGAILDIFRGIITTWSQKRNEAFFLELKRNPTMLPEGILKSDAFIHKFLITYKAVQITYTDEKIKLFARLLLNGGTDGCKVDEYEELLRTLNELSNREIHILLLFDSYYSKYLQEVVEDYKPEKGVFIGGKRIATGDAPHNRQGAAFELFQKQIYEDLENILEVRPEERKDILNRLSRTGLYEIFDYAAGPNGDGFLTPLFYNLKAFISSSELQK
jgi:hypothetical protein